MENIVLENTEIKKEEVFEEEFLSFKLASILTAYPENNFLELIQPIFTNKMALDFFSNISPNSWEKIFEIISPILTQDNIDKMDEIRSDYIDLFDRSGSPNSLYETEFGKDRSVMKTTELADISAFYQAFGVDSTNGNIHNEMADHISVELEFYSYLLMKQAFLNKNNISEGSEVVYDGRKKFIQDHLGRFTYSLSQRPGVLENEYYSALFKWVSDLVDYECQNLEVEPVKTSWLSNQAEPETMNCAEFGCGLAGNTKSEK